jgi:hypothetical protein
MLSLALIAPCAAPECLQCRTTLPGRVTTSARAKAFPFAASVDEDWRAISPRCMDLGIKLIYFNEILRVERLRACEARD